MPIIELKGVEKHVLKDINLTVRDREIFCLVGPNGSGKTTLLNIIAGLTDYKGDVLLDGVNVNPLPPHKRGVGYLLQDLALFPHLTVAQNIAYGLKVRRYPEEVIKRRVNELMDALHITKLKDLYPDKLSGGEKQRVAIARALAPFQRILLLDEPTSSLDAQAAKYVRTEIRSLLKSMEITAIFVMHDLFAAEEVADRIGILYNGKIEQVSDPKDIIFHPESERVSEFVGMPNILSCDETTVLATGLIQLKTGNMTIVLPYEGTNVKKIAIPPQDIYISRTKPPGPTLNRYTGTIIGIVPVGSVVRIKLNVEGNTLVTELSREAFNEMDLSVGQRVYVIIKLRRIQYKE